MKILLQTLGLTAVLVLGGLVLSRCASQESTAHANETKLSQQQIAADCRAALRNLYAQNPKARELGAKAKGVLVFPNVVKGGLLVGGMRGNGALVWRSGGIHEYYQSSGMSYGLQAGIQKYGYALFLMDTEAFNVINEADGWEVGGSPSLVIVDAGMMSTLTTATVQKGIYAFFFDQRGLMGGIGLQGSKITRIYPGP
jgi:lipid-binding SYLF domain-containing protein